MTTASEDARSAASAMLNRIPATMEASRTAVAFFRDVTTGDHGRLDDQSLKLMALVIVSVLTLENRLEALDGRPGVPLEPLVQLMGEFMDD